MSKRCLTCGMYSNENEVLRIKNQKLEAELQTLREAECATCNIVIDKQLKLEAEIQALREAAGRVAFECEADDWACMPSIEGSKRLANLLEGEE